MEKRFICDFICEIKIKEYNSSESEMTYLDFIIRKENMSLKNIYSIEEINKSKKLKILENYSKVFALFLNICTSIESAINIY